MKHSHTLKSYLRLEEMILPFLYQVKVGSGSPTASQSSVSLPKMSISSVSRGGIEFFHFGGTMEANVSIRDCLVK